MAGKKKNSVSAGDNSIVIGGDMQGSNIIMGSNNVVTNNVNLAPLFDEIHRKLDEKKDLAPDQKKDIKEELKEIKTALEDPAPDESFLTRRFRNIKRMAPDVLDVVLETLKNPIGGVVEIIKKVTKKMSEETGA